jgi:hypothetical protein
MSLLLPYERHCIYCKGCYLISKKHEHELEDFTEKLSWLIYVATIFPEGLRRITNLSKLPHKRFAPAKISAEVVELNDSPSGCKNFTLNTIDHRKLQHFPLTKYQKQWL